MGFFNFIHAYLLSLHSNSFSLSHCGSGFFSRSSPSLSQRNSLLFSHRSGFAFSLLHHLTTMSVITTFKQPNKDRLKVATDGKNPTFFNLTNTKSSLLDL
jgi:hypothetical protein